MKIEAIKVKIIFVWVYLSIRKWSSELLEDIRLANIQLTYEQVPFNHPLFILYSSGTTGKPKCMVHSVGVSKKIIHIKKFPFFVEKNEVHDKN